MAQSDIHKLIEEYFNATLSEQEENTLRQMLARTSEDSEDIREAKATMGLFATNRKLKGKKQPVQKPKTIWGKLKYAAVLIIGILIDTLVDIDDHIDNNFSK